MLEFRPYSIHLRKASMPSILFQIIRLRLFSASISCDWKSSHYMILSGFVGSFIQSPPPQFKTWSSAQSHLNHWMEKENMSNEYSGFLCCWKGEKGSSLWLFPLLWFLNIPYFMLPERRVMRNSFINFILYFVVDGTLDDGWGRWEWKIENNWMCYNIEGWRKRWPYVPRCGTTLPTHKAPKSWCQNDSTLYTLPTFQPHYFKEKC